MDFNNREVATALWLCTLTLFVLMRDKDGRMRGSIGGVARAFFSRPILLIISCACLWIAICVFWLERFNFWSIENLKTTLVWAVGFAFVTALDANRITDEITYFRKTVRDVLSATVIITFITEFKSFPLLVELILTPILFAVGVLMVFTQGKPEHAFTHKIFSYLAAILGLLLLGHGLLAVASDFKKFSSFETFKEFFIPIVLSLAFIPFLYVMSVLLVYERINGGIAWVFVDHRLRRYASRQAIFRFRLNLDGARRWRRNVATIRPTNREEILSSIEEVKQQQAYEQTPPHVPAAEGWSPYDATLFLASVDLKTGDYHRIGGNEWFASSPPLKISAGLLNDTITYYVEGDGRAAKRLTLVLHVNDASTSEASDLRFLEMCGVLLGSVIGRSQDLIVPNGTVDAVIGVRRVRVKREEYLTRIRGYTRTLTVDHSPEYRPLKG